MVSFEGARKVETIVFDFDGTLAELRIDFDEMKRRLTFLARRYCFSHPAPALFPALEWVEKVIKMQTQNALTIEEFQQKAKELIFHMEIEAATHAKLFPFTRSLFRRLKHRRIKTAIITRNCEQAVRLVFPDVDDHCDCLLTREHVPYVKPDPDHLLRAIQSLSADRQTTLMVGDHPLDIETGKRAKVLTAGVWSGNASQAKLLQSGPQWIAPDCEALTFLLMEQAFI